MKKSFLLFLGIVAMLSLTTRVLSQGVAISSDPNASPDPSAILDVQSTEKGMLVPRMTQAQRNALVSPAKGLMIFQTNTSPGLYINSGTSGAPSWNLVGSNAGQWLNNSSSIYYNLGFVGIGTPTPEASLTIANTSLVGIATTGSFQIGQSNTYNLVFDNNEILARNNGSASTLYLQYWGGGISACASGGTANFYGPVGIHSALNVTGRIGVKTTPSYDLHVNSSEYTAANIYGSYNGGTVFNIVAGGTTAGTWGLYAYATTLGYAGYFSGNVYCTGNYLPSDEKLKNNIQPIKNSLDKIMQLNVITYDYKTSVFPELNLPSDRQIGFTAQNIESVFPELVRINPAKKEQPVEFKAVNYVGLIPVLTGAIKEQQEMIILQSEKIDDLVSRISLLEQQFQKYAILIPKTI